MERRVRPPAEPVPPPQAGDRVRFYFIASGNARMQSRLATITKVSPYEDTLVAELEVEFAEGEPERWGISRTQRHSLMAVHPVSGTWTRHA